ncbi:DUF2946 family protein [Limnohabitans sp.]|jgi:hypothetical protein|uniref:DUF2946 family protein n=1 Tax=Limnohabitans sp. TaxID=1907725 RepID=UPI00286F4724|nr:DUF2946 family protein [Limnohabitans sp.]
MDDLVQQAMAKWPNVPDCYGWLGLDARGDWYMRDDAVQALGPFTKSKGSRLVHEKLIAFIGRNYAPDKQGQWFFQNGPQRVYVELEATPWIWRLQPDGSIQSHVGHLARMQRCIVDEHGRLYLDTEQGFGLVHTQDVLQAADLIEAGIWVPQEVLTRELPERFAYIRSPQQAQKIQT